MMTDIIRKAYRDPAKTVNQQANKGRFKPGQSGNPRGRPVGSRHKATLAALALLGNDLEAITEKLVEKAKDGEQWAITLIINKLIPNAKDVPVTLRLPRQLERAEDLKGALGTVLRAVTIGAVTTDQAKELAEVFNTLGLVLMVEDLEKKLERLGGKR